MSSLQHPRSPSSRNAESARARFGRWALLVSSGLACGVATVLVASSPGCTSGPCTTRASSFLGGVPADALECPANTVCYEGACVPSCTSGAERVEACKKDDDCANGARPTCVSGFCSACGQGERCLPKLDVCARLRADPNADGGSLLADANNVTAQSPLDGGGVDGQVLTFDGGVQITVPEEFTSHVAQLTVRELERRVGGRTTVESRAQLEALDVQTSSIADGAVLLQVELPSQSCEVRAYDTYPRGRPSHANIGDVRISPCTQACEVTEMQGGLTEEYRFAFQSGAYTVSPDVTPRLSASAPTLIRRFTVDGTGIAPITNGAWPTPAVRVQTPIALALAPSTQAIFAQPIRAATLERDGLNVAWERAIDPNGVARVNTAVLLTVEPVPGTPLRERSHYLRCRSDSREELASLRASPMLFQRLFQTSTSSTVQWELRVERGGDTRLSTNSNTAQRFNLRFSVATGVGFVTAIER
jgi:hypothetical protein